MATWRAKNPEKVRVLNRRAQLKYHYGLSEAEHSAMTKAQDGCAVCGSDVALHVDHCHRSGRVRKLLCPGCNRGLGCFRDQPHLLRAAATYLEDHET